MVARTFWSDFSLADFWLLLVGIFLVVVLIG